MDHDNWILCCSLHTVLLATFGSLFHFPPLNNMSGKLGLEREQRIRRFLGRETEIDTEKEVTHPIFSFLSGLF